MRSTLWAIEAAKKNKANDIIPGTSRHVTAEMLTNLKVAKDGLTTFNDRLLACVEQLNGIIDAINADSPELLERAADLSLANVEIKDESSQFSKTSMEVHLELRLASSEKHILRDSERETLQEAAKGEKMHSGPILEGEKLGQMESDQARRASAEHSQPKRESTGNERQSEERKNNKQRNDQKKNIPSPTLHRPPLEARTDDMISALSPIHIPRTAPISSPNVNLSFIPIANSINPQKFETRNTDLESDTSFQAISTAIRKSFAGKLSMGQFTGSLPLYSDARDETEARLNSHDSRSVLRAGNNAEPQESPDSSSKQVTAQAPQNRNRSMYTKRVSVFVALPDREPISYLNSRHSIKVKSEESEKVSSVALPNAEPRDATAASLSIARNLNLRFPEKEKVLKNVSPEAVQTTQTKLNPAPRPRPDLLEITAKVEPEQKAESEAKIEPTPGVAPKAGRPNLRASTIPRISPGKPPSRARSPNREERSRPAQLKRFSTRTTDSGSPNREHSSNSKLNGAGNDRNRGVTRRTDVSFKVRSSRSPTKQSQVSHAENGKEAPSDHNGSERVKVKVEQESLLRLTLPTSSSTAKAARTSQKEPMLKNRFLTTTLHPEKPPHFSAKSKRSPLKRAPTERVLKGSMLLKYEPSARPKQKINLSINHQEREGSSKESRESNRSTLPTERLVTSPRRADAPPARSVKRTAEPQDIHVAPRKRALGNAVPLPDAARGIFTGDRNKEKRKNVKTLATPSRPHTMNGRSLTEGGISHSPAIRPDALPEIPSDDDALRSKKYLKSWAETPELLRMMRENKDLDPVAVFGDVPVLKMDDVFEGASSRQRGMASPKASPSE